MSQFISPPIGYAGLEGQRQLDLSRRQLVETLTYGVSTVSNDGVGETDLITYNIEPNVLQAEGQSIFMEAGGAFTNTSNHQIKAYLGSTNIFDSGSFAPLSATVGWVMHLRLIRITALSQLAFTLFGEGSGAFFYSPFYVSATEDLRTRLSFRVTANGGVAGSTDMYHYKMFLEA